MPRSGISLADLGAIALGGVAGASLRWLVTTAGDPTGTAGRPAGGWFTYAPNTSVTIGRNQAGIDFGRSGQTLELATGIPTDTLAVNVVGCLVLGVLTALLARSASSTVNRRFLIGGATGFCGSLTTFSSFAVEVAVLLRGRPVLPPELSAAEVLVERNLATAFAYVAASIAFGGVAFWLGRLLSRRFTLSRPAGTRAGAVDPSRSAP